MISRFNLALKLEHELLWKFCFMALWLTWNMLSIYSHFASTETSMTTYFAFASFFLFILLTCKSYARILHPSLFFISSTEQGGLNLSTDFIPIKTKLTCFIFYLPTWTIYFLQMVAIKSRILSTGISLDAE